MKYELWDVYETLASEESGELLCASDSMAEIKQAARQRIEDTDGECRLLVKKWLDPEKRDV